MAEPNPEPPPAHIQEFNTIAGLIFVQLYSAFPDRINIDPKAVAKAIGMEGENWNGQTLPSGRSFMAMFSSTSGWLCDEGFTRSRGASPSEGVTLSSRGLGAMNAVPTGLKQSVGTALVDASRGSGTPDLTRVGSLIGGAIGGIVKTLSG